MGPGSRLVPPSPAASLFTTRDRPHKTHIIGRALETVAVAGLRGPG